MTHSIVVTELAKIIFSKEYATKDASVQILHFANAKNSIAFCIEYDPMALPINKSFLPMEARSVGELPQGARWQYEPKWDGFRCLVFRENSHIWLQSKAGQMLGRYFPELEAAFLHLRTKKFVLDGEIVVPLRGRSSFDQLLMRVHPAESRIKKLSSEFPAMFIIFDLIVDERGTSLIQLPLERRREKLEKFNDRYLQKTDQLKLSPSTKDRAVAERWLHSRTNGLDGVVAKRADLPYMSGTRDGMQKIKLKQTVDCVAGGFRYASRKKVIGSLLLGLYDKAGTLNHVGFTSSFSKPYRKELLSIVRPLIGGSGFTGKSPGGPSRWSTKRSGEWVPLSPKLVVEVTFDNFTGGRFRHGTKFVRFRPDKKPQTCTDDQVNFPRGTDLKLLNASATGKDSIPRKAIVKK